MLSAAKDGVEEGHAPSEYRKKYVKIAKKKKKKNLQGPLRSD